MTRYPLRISPVGITLIKKYQGLSLEKYRDESGLWVIGYGHIISSAENFDRGISPCQAEKLFNEDIARCEQALWRYLPVTLSQYQYDALISLIFSCGVLACLRRGIFADIQRRHYSRAIARWRGFLAVNGKEIPGLAAQRQAECELFTTATEMVW